MAKIDGTGIDGFYGDCVNVSILNLDDRVEYSIDGGRLWTPYNVPFEICSSTTVLYRGIRSKGISKPKIVAVNIDKNPPEILPVIEPSPNPEGWNNSEVTISFICRDRESGIKECPSPVRLSEEESFQSVKASAKDKVGNEGFAEVKINIDRTPPAVSITGLVEGRMYFLCDRPSADFRAQDTISGVKDAKAFTIPDDKVVGSFKYIVRATDRAGNLVEEVRSYQIIYKFEGFGAPVSYKKPFKQGSVVPIRFKLSDGCGNRIIDAQAKFTIELVSRFVSEDPTVEIDDEPLFGDRGDLFSYDYVTGEYVYNLSTESLFSGIWKISVTLNDGKTYSEMITIK
ncbi:MAG: PxKF domain-containing protein [Thermodesulfovibrionales bacterium]